MALYVHQEHSYQILYAKKGKYEYFFKKTPKGVYVRNIECYFLLSMTTIRIHFVIDCKRVLTIDKEFYLKLSMSNFRNKDNSDKTNGETRKNEVVCMRWQSLKKVITDFMCITFRIIGFHNFLVTLFPMFAIVGTAIGGNSQQHTLYECLFVCSQVYMNVNNFSAMILVDLSLYVLIFFWRYVLLTTIARFER